jgi:hypothetical protein
MQMCIIIIIIIIIIILGISFMQGIYTYIPETNHVPREHCVAAILMQLFTVRISLVPALTTLSLIIIIKFLTSQLHLENIHPSWDM